MQELISLLKELDLYISQHAIYVSKLEKALERREPFEHKTCRECNFGRKFYSEIYPFLQDFKEHIRSLILEIEKLHCTFHELACKINTSNPSQEDIELLKEVKRQSTKLFQELLKLRKRVLSGGEQELQ